LAQIPDTVTVERVRTWDPRPAAWRGLQHRELTLLWRWPALAAGRKMMRAGRFDAIAATAPPPVAHAVAAQLAREFGVPWVADFRDPWSVRRPGVWRRWRRRVYASSAASVVAVNDALCGHLSSSLRRPVRTLYNGFEPDEMPSRRPYAARRSLFLGTLSESTDLDVFYRALARLDGEFVHIGATQRYNLKQRAAASGLTRVTSTGYLPRARALREAADAGVYVLSVRADLDLTLPAKVFDYLGLGGPVLCVGDRGAAAEFVRRHEGLGLCVPAHDEEAICRGLETLWQRSEPWPPARRRAYARPQLAGMLARILDAAAGAP
jgi:glycosyltransferase involved in cell wall biosynthesis